uniref:Uncharacterized protein n=1 Tax=Rhizophora mucronata TaxID=61149 RepID=A0A2P2NLB7_RHIMU
MRTASEREGF